MGDKQPHIVDMIFYRVAKHSIDVATDRLLLAVDEVNNVYGTQLRVRLLRLVDEDASAQGRIVLLIEYTVGTSSREIFALRQTKVWGRIEAILRVPGAQREAELLLLDVT